MARGACAFVSLRILANGGVLAGACDTEVSVDVSKSRGPDSRELVPGGPNRVRLTAGARRPIVKRTPPTFALRANIRYFVTFFFFLGKLVRFNYTRLTGER